MGGVTLTCSSDQGKPCVPFCSSRFSFGLLIPALQSLTASMSWMGQDDASDGQSQKFPPIMKMETLNRQHKVNIGH